MATTKDAMTPEEAAAAIAEVREYRQGLTARAAGMIWMVWGLVVATASIGNAIMWTAGISRGAASDPLAAAFFGAVFAAGFIATYAIWHAQALVTGQAARLVAGAGLVAGLTFLFALFVNPLLIIAVDAVVDGPGPHFGSAMGISWASGAATIVILQRRHVSWWPGTVAVAGGLAIQVAYPFLVGESTALGTYARASLLIGTIGLSLYFFVGLWHFKRG